MNVPKNNQSPLKDVIDSLSTCPEEAQDMLANITAGDEMLRTYSDPTLSKDANSKVQQAMVQQLKRHKRRKSPVGIILRIAAVLLVGTIIASLFDTPTQNDPTQPIIAQINPMNSDAELISLELGLLETDCDNLAFDEMSADGILSLWEDQGWDIEIL